MGINSDHPQEYFRARLADGSGLDDFHWSFTDVESRPKGYSGPTRQEALDAAMTAAGAGGTVEVRNRTRMNDYVGSPNWGNDCCVDTIKVIERTTRHDDGNGMTVHVTLIDHGEPVELPVKEAAALMVEQYGQRAHDQSISGLRSAFNAYWAEVDRLLENRPAGAQAYLVTAAYAEVIDTPQVYETEVFATSAEEAERLAREGCRQDNGADPTDDDSSYELVDVYARPKVTA